MDVTTLKAKIKSKQLPSYLIFSGPEWKVQQIYILQIAKSLSKSVRYIDCLDDIQNRFKNRSFMSQSFVYVVRDDKELLTNISITERLNNGVLGDNILIHIITTVDKRTKFYKEYKDSIIEFDYLSQQILTKYIKKEISLSDKNCYTLIEICEHDYGRILLEIDKIKRIGKVTFTEVGNDNNYDADATFQMLLKDGTIYQPPYDAIFDLVAAILDRNVRLSFDLLDQCYSVGEATLVMLSVLYNNAKAVLQLQTCESNDVTKSTGLNGWQIKNAKPHVGKYADEELVDMLYLIQSYESGIKTGNIEEEFVMPLLLTKVLRV